MPRCTSEGHGKTLDPPATPVNEVGIHARHDCQAWPAKSALDGTRAIIAWCRHCHRRKLNLTAEGRRRTLSSRHALVNCLEFRDDGREEGEYNIEFDSRVG